MIHNSKQIFKIIKKCNMPDPTHNTKNQEIKIDNKKINFKNNKIIQ